MITAVRSNRVPFEELTLEESRIRSDRYPTVSNINHYGMSLLMEDQMEEAYEHWKQANRTHPESAKILQCLLSCIELLPRRGVEAMLACDFTSLQRARIVTSEEIPDCGGIVSQARAVSTMSYIMSRDMFTVRKVNDDDENMEATVRFTHKTERQLYQVASIIKPLIQSFGLYETPYRAYSPMVLGNLRDVPTMFAERELWNVVHRLNHCFAHVGHALSVNKAALEVDCKFSTAPPSDKVRTFSVLDQGGDIHLLLWAWYDGKVTPTTLNRISGGYWDVLAHPERFINMTSIRYQ